MNTYKPQEFAEMIGVSVKTLQRWDNDKKLKAYRSPTDRRYYTHKQYVDYKECQSINLRHIKKRGDNYEYQNNRRHDCRLK